jgi:hypothetical protein
MRWPWLWKKQQRSRLKKKLRQAVHHPSHRGLQAHHQGPQAHHKDLQVHLPPRQGLHHKAHHKVLHPERLPQVPRPNRAGAYPLSWYNSF